MHSDDLNREKASGFVLEPLWLPCRALWWNRELSPWQPHSTDGKNDAPTQKVRGLSLVFPFFLKSSRISNIKLHFSDTQPSCQ